MHSDLTLLTDWIESGGGPFALASREATTHWRGVGPHYDMACSGKEWCNRVDVGSRQFAILFGEPMPAIAVWFRDVCYILRGYYAESEGACIDAFASWVDDFQFQRAPDSRTEFSCGPSDLMLFDSAYSGERIVNGKVGDAYALWAVQFRLDHQVSGISSFFVEYDRKTAFVVDALEPSST